MYLAHSSPGLAAKGLQSDVPLWVLLLCGWSIDITGVGHWLPAAGALVLLAALVLGRFFGRAAGLLAAGVVAVDFCLDLVTGVQVWPNGPLVGPLWGRRNHAIDFLIEAAI